MERIVLLPGTFDPVTLGHVDIAMRAVKLFDKVVIGIGTNIAKVPMYSVEQRKAWLDEIFKDEPRITTSIYQGLTVDFCQKINAQFIIRGIRFVSDFEYEKMIADMNRSLDQKIETIFLTCLPIYNSVASTMVRDVIKNNGDASQFLPEVVRNTIYSQNK